MQVSELFLFPEMVDPPQKSERLPGSGKIEKIISERCLREMSARKEEEGAGGKGERIEPRGREQRIGARTRTDLSLQLALVAGKPEHVWRAKPVPFTVVPIKRGVCGSRLFR